MEEIVQKSNGDDLDLLQIIQKLINFFLRFGFFLLVFLALGIFLALFLYKITPKQYESKLIVRSNILTNEEEIEVIQNWNDLMKKGDYSAVSSILNCNPNILKKVRNITATQIQKLYIQNNPNGVVIDVFVTDTSILTYLQNALLYGLSNSSYVQERISIKRENLNDLISKIKIEISKLDSTKTNVQNIIINNKKESSNLLIDVSNINGQWMVLVEKLHGYQEELKFINAFQILQNFDKPSKPEKPKLSYYLFFGLIGGGFIGYLIALFKIIHEKLYLQKS
jgi:LPS O-antigen subunit length determinant protein (WzzB/FepE family)